MSRVWNNMGGVLGQADPVLTLRAGSEEAQGNDDEKACIF